MTDSIAKLKAEITDKSRLVEILSKYPDIKEHTNRWKRHHWVSRSVNDRASLCRIHHECGCCSDSPLEVWPYLVDDGVEIYSDPPCFRVGEKNAYGIGDRPYDYWQDKLRADGINAEIIAQIEQHFADNQEVIFRNEEEEED